MNDSRKYEYILEPAEIREFCRKALVDDLKKGKCSTCCFS